MMHEKSSINLPNFTPWSHYIKKKENIKISHGHIIINIRQNTCHKQHRMYKIHINKTVALKTQSACYCASYMLHVAFESIIPVCTCL